MRVVVVDDHEIVRTGLRMVLPSDPEITVVAEAKSPAEALTAVRQMLPDVVLTDYRLPGMAGDELCRRILEIAPSTHVIILTTYLSEDVVQRSIDAGAAGFVTKEAGLDELRDVLAELAHGPGRLRLSPTSATVKRLHRAGPEDPDGRPLTPQQRRVLELAASGLTYPQISEQLHISESTVRFHIRTLKERFEARTKTELIAMAIRSALIAPGQDPVSA
jgi:two-component system response regulator DevR